MIKDTANRLECLLAGEATLNPPKLVIKVMAHIDGINTGNTVVRLQSSKMYARANLDGLKIFSKF